MPPALAHASRDLALDLYELLRELDPARWREELLDSARARFSALRGRIEKLLGTTWPDALEPLLERVRAVAQALPDAPPGTSDGWRILRERLSPLYEDLAAGLRDWEVHVPSLRPTNYARNLLHIGSAVATVLIAELLLQTYGQRVAVTAAVALAAWTMETSRRVSPGVNRLLMALFQPTAHPHERHRVNSATWYATALLLMGVHGSLAVGVTAMIVLGLADPSAALIGRRFGRTPTVNGRTLEGSMAFGVVGTFAGLGVLTAFHPEIAPQWALAMAAGAAAVGAVAEALARYVDDNLVVPVAAAVGAFVVGWLVGAPLF